MDLAAANNSGGFASQNFFVFCFMFMPNLRRVSDGCTVATCDTIMAPVNFVQLIHNILVVTRVGIVRTDQKIA
jgi:hypothetical protein